MFSVLVFCMAATALVLAAIAFQRSSSNSTTSHKDTVKLKMKDMKLSNSSVELDQQQKHRTDFATRKYPDEVNYLVGELCGTVSIVSEQDIDGLLFVTVRWGDKIFQHTVDMSIVQHFPEMANFYYTVLVSKNQLEDPNVEIEYRATVPLQNVFIKNLYLTIQPL